jgi:hypothetical protein
MNAPAMPRYLLRIGINYHGNKVQHLQIDADTGRLIGWNADGNALGTGADAKMLLSGFTIFERDDEEQVMSDTKIGGGEIPAGTYIRTEFKARGWLGKTKNLDGKQLMKDLNLLRDDRADLLVICLSETAHRKWRGEGPAHQVARRECDIFQQILMPTTAFDATPELEVDIAFIGEPTAVAVTEDTLAVADGEAATAVVVPTAVAAPPAQPWHVSARRVVATAASAMPGAEHYVTLCWRI